MKKALWGGEFWTDGYYFATVSERGDKKVIEGYIKKQGREEDIKQLTLFELCRPVLLEQGIYVLMTNLALGLFSPVSHMIFKDYVLSKLTMNILPPFGLFFLQIVPPGRFADFLAKSNPSFLASCMHYSVSAMMVRSKLAFIMIT